jgi:hypothetical protein
LDEQPRSADMDHQCNGRKAIRRSVGGALLPVTLNSYECENGYADATNANRTVSVQCPCMTQGRPRGESELKAAIHLRQLAGLNLAGYRQPNLPLQRSAPRVRSPAGRQNVGPAS